MPTATRSLLVQLPLACMLVDLEMSHTSEVPHSSAKHEWMVCLSLAKRRLWPKAHGHTHTHKLFVITDLITTSGKLRVKGGKSNLI